MNILGYIVLAAGEGFFLWQKTRDWAKSALQPLHLPPGEQNFLTRGKDGYFSATKSYIVNGVVIAVFTLAAIFIPQEHTPFVVGGMFFAWGLFVMNGIRKDIERLEANKARQIEILTKLRADPDEPHVPKPTLRGFGPDKHVFVSSSFYDFHEETDIPIGIGVQWDPAKATEALSKIKPRLVALSKLPESEWFKRDRAEGI